MKKNICQLLVANDVVKTPKAAFLDYNSTQIETFLRDAFEEEKYEDISVSKFVRSVNTYDVSKETDLVVHFKVYSNNAMIASFELIEVILL